MSVRIVLFRVLNCQLRYSLYLSPAEYNNSRLAEIAISITKGTEERKYHPNDYLDLLYDSYFPENFYTVHKSTYEMYIISLDARADINIHAELFKSMLYNPKEPIEQYDFAPQINKVNTIVDTLNEKMEAERRKLELKKLDNEVHFWKDPRWYYGLLVGAVGMFAALASVYFGWLKCKS